MSKQRSILLVVIGVLTALGIAILQSPIRQQIEVWNNASFTGFIVADAHFGAPNPDQPSNEAIQDAMHHIVQQFPDLDVVWDAGDAHHKAEKDGEREEWLTYLAGEVPQKPLYYTGGNHELDNFNSPYDPEERVLQLGSLTARPYYSVDIKNVHLISLPELIDVNYLSAEELAWLDLDLQLNQDKTVIIISHNALANTTKTDAKKIAYRRLANSDAIFERMEKYKNIRAWIHGHNHTYEVFQRDGTLFVSAGRMGGFNGDRKTDLKLNADDLGGIYVEVTRRQLTVRAYNASKHAFMDELGYPGLTETLEFKTALKPGAPVRYSYGYGLARNGQRIPIYNHHLGATRREVFVRGTPGPIFSDNPLFTSFSQDRKRGKTLNAIAISPKDAYEWLEPSIQLFPSRPAKKITVSLSTQGSSMWSYYRIAPDRSYQAMLKLDAVEGGQQVLLQAKVHDSDGTVVATLPEESWSLTEAPQTILYSFQIPDLSSYPSIYSDPTSDRQFQLSVEAQFSNMEQPVTMQQFSVQMGDDEVTTHPTIMVDDERYESGKALASDQYVRFDLPKDIPQRSVIETRADGNGLLTFLIRETGMKWQVRNAMTTQTNDGFVIGPMRNHFGNYRDILITPLSQPSQQHQQRQPYLNKLSHIEQAKVLYDGSGLNIELLDVDGAEGELTVVASKQPRQVLGAKDWSFADGHLDIVATQGDRVTIDF